MNIALLSGADKNAGDFLIVHRAKKLIEQEIPDCVLHEFKRNEDLESSLDEVNSCDVVLFAGGPGYMQDMYPNKMPLVGDLNRIKPPFFAMGMGAYSLSANVESYLFTDQSRTLLERFERDGFGLGCRDGLTEDILHQVGVRNTLMTGCPAWYDLDKIEAQVLFRRPVQGNIDHIAISDPARPENIPLACSLVRYVVEELQPRKITFVFHRGWKSDQYSRGYLATCQQNLKTWLDRQRIDVCGIEYSNEGFGVYNDTDMHIGFRVHAHIYNMSQRHPSFLIEEDGRGWGLDETLGLDHIGKLASGTFGEKARIMSPYVGAMETLFSKRRSQPVLSKLDSVIHAEFESDFSKMRAAFKKMEESYSVMRNHLRKLA